MLVYNGRLPRTVWLTLLGPEARCGRRHPTARSAATRGYCGWSYRQIEEGKVEIQTYKLHRLITFDSEYENVYNLNANTTILI